MADHETGRNPPQLMSVTRAAQILDCSRGHVYNLAAAGHFRLVEIKATGTRPKTRLFAEEVEAFINKRTRPSARVERSMSMDRPIQEVMVIGGGDDHEGHDHD